VSNDGSPTQNIERRINDDDDDDRPQYELGTSGASIGLEHLNK
jgi:hypothetical protein